MRTKRSHEGYLLIDHRATHEGTFESATITCAHCHRIVVLNPQRTRERGYCSRCDHYICDSPECNLECNPLKKVLDTIQEQALRGLNISPGGIILP